MKTREGFVSNSSTSSFVIIGYMLEDSKMERVVKSLLGVNELSEDWQWEELGDTGLSIQSLEDDDSIIGISPLSIDEYGISEAEVDIQDIMSKLDKLKKVIETDEPPKMFGGTYAC